MQGDDRPPPWQRLLGFTRRVTDASEPGEVAELLVAEVVATVPGAGAAVLEVDRGGLLRVEASCGMSFDEDLELSADLLGPELNRELARRCGLAVEGVTTYPLVSSHDLYGALVLCLEPGASMSGEQRQLIEAMIDLGGIALGKALQYQRLRSAYDQLAKSRRELVRSEKLRALGQLAASISHDIRNVLNPLSLQLQLLKRRMSKDPDKAEEIVTTIEEVVRHGVDITHRLREFGRDPAEAKAAPVGLDEAARNAIALCGPRLRSIAAPIEVMEDLADGRDVILVFSEAVAALVNLVVNAVDAMPYGGTIAVRTGGDESHSWVEVEDSGTGMPPSVRERAFEAFYSTKGEEGTGLGLAMVDAFASRHGGNVALDSEPERGTRIRITFPIAEVRAAGDQGQP